MALAAAEQPLSHWLRLLWDAAPPLHLDSEAPFIAAGAIHLPPRPLWQQHRAAAAHAVAHLVYSPLRFDATGLVPTTRALLGLLEDARVENLAMRELPGLARLWRPLHIASPASGFGSPALMARLARALADPGYRDNHPWVAKGRRLFYLDESLALPALRTAAELREAALRLGHDLGQMRLPFNAAGDRPLPAYRDDHRWMWAADALRDAQPPPAPQPVAADPPPDPPPEDMPAPGPEETWLHPEWDRLIHRLRPDWVRVTESPAPRATAAAVPPTLQAPHSAPLRTALQGLARPPGARRRAAEGEALHLDALLAWATARRCGLPGDARVFHAHRRQAGRSAACLLVDRSASTAAPLGPGDDSGPAVLGAAAHTAAATARALHGLGVACAVLAFASNGRHAVQLHRLQGLHDAPAGDLARRLAALQPAGSTRLGAVLRQATAHLAGGRWALRWVLLLSDGQPHDVDVHDPHYLVDDARHAVRAARRRGVRMACLALGERPSPAAQRIFGTAGCQHLPGLAALPRALRRLSG